MHTVVMLRDWGEHKRGTLARFGWNIAHHLVMIGTARYVTRAEADRIKRRTTMLGTESISQKGAR